MPPSETKIQRSSKLLHSFWKVGGRSAKERVEEARASRFSLELNN
jgi:hypothetical protein